jgi:hypothetical protein
MTTDGPTFLGAVLKVIACTPNGNFDTARYEREVLEPSRRLRRMAEDQQSRPLSEEQMREVLTLLISILQAKQVEPREREERLAELLTQFQLRERFAELRA